MTKVAIIHGTLGSPAGNWFPWLAAELKKRSVEVFVPRMPTPEGQSLSNWREAFRSQVGAVDESSVIIGHSVGAVFLLRLLESFRSPIKASVFVAGFIGSLGIPEYDNLNASFINGPYQWELIRRNVGTPICLSGENDPYVPRVQGLQLAKNLGTSLVLLPEGGHLNAEFGYTLFPLLLETLRCYL